MFKRFKFRIFFLRGLTHTQISVMWISNIIPQLNVESIAFFNY